MSFEHSVCRWCFENTPLPELAAWCRELGIQGIDLLTPSEAQEIKEFGRICPISTFPTTDDGLGCIERAFNKIEHHAPLQALYADYIPECAAAGIKQVILFSGNRDGLSDEEGLHNCATGIVPLLEIAEAHDITLVMELLNSRIDHPDYQCDHTEWGVALCEKLDSPSFKLLYDIYHMQVMEGDVIATIERHAKHISHYHTAGVPGRNEIDGTQELYYPAIIEAIRSTGFNGFIAQEFIPTWEKPQEALLDSIKRCS
ncbi:TIM barrel protein [Akkermansiaceae bacterium]|nr:TIM barrel protein [Akkermansiaceae bacterium]MDB4419105.1 TIM barrel protein [bacterium]